MNSIEEVRRWDLLLGGARDDERPETRWARTVDGACIAYQDLGRGPDTLVVIHGWVSHLEVYWEQPGYVRFLQCLSRMSSTVKDRAAGSGTAASIRSRACRAPGRCTPKRPRPTDTRSDR